MDIITFLENYILRFKKEFKIKKSIKIIIEENLGNRLMGVNLYKYTDNDELFYLIKCNINLLQKMSNYQVIHTLLHEFGHIKSKHVDLTDKVMLPDYVKEYQAERFALKYIKKNFSSYYIDAIKELNTYKDNSHYNKAYTKLYEELKGKNE